MTTKMEKQMPDLQTELTKALEEGKRKFLSSTLEKWDKHEQTIRQPAQPKEKAMQTTKKVFAPTCKNLSKDLFEFIKLYSGEMDTAMAKEAMVACGYKKSSIFSLITQMKRAKMIEDRDGKLYAIVHNYRPVNRTYNRKLQQRKVKAGLAALPAATTAPTAPTQPLISSTWDAARALDHLSIKQARALYDELSKIFGGK